MVTVAPPNRGDEKTFGGTIPKVGVVIVNYRTPGMTADCVRSVLKCAGVDLRIYVVENGSNDNSATRLQRDLGNTVQLIVAACNGGYTAGNNLGFAAALADRCECVLALNPDTQVVHADFLSRLAQHLRSHPEIGAVGPAVDLREIGVRQNTVLRYPWFWRRIVDGVVHRLTRPPVRSADQALDVEALNGVCVLYRSDCLRSVGVLDERIFAYVDEADWGLRARRRGWKLAYLPVGSVIHLQSESGYERGTTVDFLLKRNTVFFLLKNRRVFQAAGYTLATLLLCALVQLRVWKRAEVRDRMARQNRHLLASYWYLWTGRWNRAMGRPAVLAELAG